MSSESLTKQFSKARKLYVDTGKVAKSIILDLLKDNSIPYHLVQSRVKKSASLRKKINSKAGKYKKLTDITDLLGLRIILYTDDQVKEVEKLLLNDDDLKVDFENMLDKSEGYGAVFGYRSLHHIFSIVPSEYFEGDPPAKDIRFEVQIKTILSHSWAEITHDIGYKPSSPMPEEAKRKMFRIAALLELADKEFTGFKNLCEAFHQAYKLQNSTNERDVPISEQSLQIYLNSDNTLTRFEDANSMYGGQILDRSLKSTYHDANMVRLLNDVNVKTLHELSTEIKRNEVWLKDQIIDNYCGTPDHGADRHPPERGYLLMYIIRILYSKKINSLLEEIGPI